MLRNCLVTYRPAASFAASACVGPVLHFQRSQAGVIQEAPRRTRNLGEMLLQLESLGRSIRRIRTHVLAIQKRCVNGIDDHPSNLLLCIFECIVQEAMFTTTHRTSSSVFFCQGSPTPTALRRRFDSLRRVHHDRSLANLGASESPDLEALKP